MRRGFICAKSSEFIQNFINKTVDISSFENIKKAIESIEDCSINISDIVFYDNIIDVQRTSKVSSYGFQSFDKKSEISLFVNEIDFEFNSILFINKNLCTDKAIYTLLYKIKNSLSNYNFNLPISIQPLYTDQVSKIIGFNKIKSSNLIPKIVELDFSDPVDVVNKNCDLFFENHSDLINCSSVIDFTLIPTLYINTNSNVKNEKLIKHIKELYKYIKIG